MQYNNQAYLSLVWKDPKERKQYIIGRLSKCEEFVFKYDDEIKNALKAAESARVQAVIDGRQTA